VEGIMTEEVGDKTFHVTYTAKYAGAFTLNADSTFTGEIEVLLNEWSHDGSSTKRWLYYNNEFTLFEYGNVIKYKATVTSSELVFEYSVSGTDGYGKAIYTRSAVTVPPIPTQITNLYTGSASVFHGVWVLTKLEENYCNADGSDPQW
jgi:hypothetical protein